MIIMQPLRDIFSKENVVFYQRKKTTFISATKTPYMIKEMSDNIIHGQKPSYPGYGGLHLLFSTAFHKLELSGESISTFARFEGYFCPANQHLTIIHALPDLFISTYARLHLTIIHALPDLFANQLIPICAL